MRLFQQSRVKHGYWLVGGVGLLLALLVAVACQGTPNPQRTPTAMPGYRDISIAQFREMLANKDFLLVNVHIPYEGEIENTALFVPYDQIGQMLSLLPQDKGAKIILYCRSGRMSEIAAKELSRLGYTNVFNVLGGMVEWENSGYPLVRR